MIEFYAIVREENPSVFLAKAKTINEIENKKESSYWAQKGMSSKGSQFEMADYMQGKKIVKVTIFDI